MNTNVIGPQEKARVSTGEKAVVERHRPETHTAEYLQVQLVIMNELAQS